MKENLYKALQTSHAVARVLESKSLPQFAVFPQLRCYQLWSNRIDTFQRLALLNARNKLGAASNLCHLGVIFQQGNEARVEGNRLAVADAMK
jgi:hypothetical protein